MHRVFNKFYFTIVVFRTNERYHVKWPLTINFSSILYLDCMFFQRNTSAYHYWITDTEISCWKCQIWRLRTVTFGVILMETRQWVVVEQESPNSSGGLRILVKELRKRDNALVLKSSQWSQQMMFQLNANLIFIHMVTAQPNLGIWSCFSVLKEQFQGVQEMWSPIYWWNRQDIEGQISRTQRICKKGRIG